jgi:hypothetical protein
MHQFGSASEECDDAFRIAADGSISHARIHCRDATNGALTEVGLELVDAALGVLEAPRHGALAELELVNALLPPLQ